MPYAVELYFDTTTEAAVRHIWQAIAGGGFRSPMLEAGYRPHISLGVYDSEALNLARLQQDLTSYAKTISPFALEMSSIGLFPTTEGVIFLGVTVTPKLLELHAGYHRTFGPYAKELRAYYDVGKWVPHCTLSFGAPAEDSARILPICWRTSLPLRGQVQEIGLAKVSPTSCELLSLCPLA